MALQKEKELENGTVGNYWVAEPKVNALTKQTDVIMLLFKDKATRDAGKNFLLRERVPSIDGTYLTGEQVYAVIKESRMSETTPAVEGKEAVLDEEGNVLEEAAEAQEATFEETNWFANATDV